MRALISGGAGFIDRNLRGYRRREMQNEIGSADLVESVCYWHSIASNVDFYERGIAALGRGRNILALPVSKLSNPTTLWPSVKMALSQVGANVDDLVEGIVRCSASEKTRGTIINLGNRKSTRFANSPKSCVASRIYR